MDYFIRFVGSRCELNVFGKGESCNKAGLLWTVIFLYPSIFVIQEICGRIGLLTGSGLAAILGKKYSKRKVVLPIISLLIIANTINIGADIGAMAASASLIIPQIPLNIFSIFLQLLLLLLLLRFRIKIMFKY